MLGKGEELGVGMGKGSGWEKGSRVIGEVKTEEGGS